MDLLTYDSVGFVVLQYCSVVNDVERVLEICMCGYLPKILLIQLLHVLAKKPESNASPGILIRKCLQFKQLTCIFLSFYKMPETARMELDYDFNSFQLIGFNGVKRRKVNRLGTVENTVTIKC